MTIKNKYYENNTILFELIHQLKHRETCFIPYSDENKSTPPIRWLNASCIVFLQRHFKKYRFLIKKMNIYHSLTTYKDFPTFSYIWNIKAQQQKLWLDEFHKYILEYDFFIETDSDDDFNEALVDTTTIKELFDEFKLRYYVKFSGSKGFHQIISHDDFAHIDMETYNHDLHINLKDFRKIMSMLPFKKKDYKKVDKVLLFKAMALRIKLMYSCDTVDTSVQDVKRVVKLAYSVDVKSGLIAYPLDDKQLSTFKKEDYYISRVLLLRNYKRGLLWRNDEQSLEQRQQNMTKFLKYIGVIE